MHIVFYCLNVSGLKLGEKKHNLMPSTVWVLSCLPAAGAHSEASRLLAQLSQWEQDSSRVRTLTAHSQGSLKENPPASAFTAETATLQHQPGRETVREERGRQTERQTGMSRGERTRGQAAALIPPRQSPNEADSSPCLSLQLTFPPRPLCWLHAILSVSPPSPALKSLWFSFSWTPPPIHSSSFCSHPSLPPHFSTLGVYADSATFVRVFVKIREKFCSAGWGGGCVMQPRGRARHTAYPNAPFINRQVLSLITSPSKYQNSANHKWEGEAGVTLYSTRLFFKLSTLQCDFAVFPLFVFPVSWCLSFHRLRDLHLLLSSPIRQAQISLAKDN